MPPAAPLDCVHTPALVLPQYFMATFEATIQQLKAQGKFDDGIVTIHVRPLPSLGVC